MSIYGDNELFKVINYKIKMINMSTQHSCHSLPSKFVLLTSNNSGFDKSSETNRIEPGEATQDAKDSVSEYRPSSIKVAFP